MKLNKKEIEIIKEALNEYEKNNYSSRNEEWQHQVNYLNLKLEVEE